MKIIPVRALVARLGGLPALKGLSQMEVEVRLRKAKTEVESLMAQRGAPVQVEPFTAFLNRMFPAIKEVPAALYYAISKMKGGGYQGHVEDAKGALQGDSVKAPSSQQALKALQDQFKGIELTPLNKPVKADLPTSIYFEWKPSNQLGQVQAVLPMPAFTQKAIWFVIQVGSRQVDTYIGHGSPLYEVGESFHQDSFTTLVAAAQSCDAYVAGELARTFGPYAPIPQKDGSWWVATTDVRIRERGWGHTVLPSLKQALDQAARNLTADQDAINFEQEEALRKQRLMEQKQAFDREYSDIGGEDDNPMQRGARIKHLSTVIKLAGTAVTRKQAVDLLLQTEHGRISSNGNSYMIGSYPVTLTMYQYALHRLRQKEEEEERNIPITPEIERLFGMR